MMEKVISNEMTRMMMILGAITVVLSLIMVRMASALKALFAPYRKQTIIYGIISLLFFALAALIGYPSLIDSPVVSFIFIQLYFLLLGILHTYSMKKNLAWANDTKAFYLDLVFTILIGLAGTIVFLLVYRWLDRTGFIISMSAGILFFVIPFLFYKTYISALAIPPKIMKEWFYPVDQEIDEPEDSKLKNLLVISFEFRKQTGDNNLTGFRAKAPAEMEFGELFYYFINDYNERHPDSKIHFTDSDGKPYGWVFYKKPDWKTILTRYIDSGKTIINNRIRENDVIVCARSVN